MRQKKIKVTVQDLDSFTTHGDKRKHKYSARQDKWETVGAINALERLAISVMKASKASGKETYTIPEIICTFRIALASHHEKLAELTGKEPKYTMVKAIQALLEDCGVDLTDK